MKIVRLIITFIISILVQAVFLAPKTLILCIDIITSILLIIKKTLTYLMKLIIDEVQNIIHYGEAIDEKHKKERS